LTFNASRVNESSSSQNVLRLFELKSSRLKKRKFTKNRLNFWFLWISKRHISNKNTDSAYDLKTKVSITSCVLYHDFRTAYKTWDLEIEMSINNTELCEIEKTTKWSKTLQNFNYIWIFIDSQNAIRCIENFTHFLTDEIYETVENLTNTQTHIHWIFEHADISENEKANRFAKSVFSSSIITRDKFLSFKFLNNQITKHNRQK
jgi:ribonuclease HI